MRLLVRIAEGRPAGTGSTRIRLPRSASFTIAFSIFCLLVFMAVFGPWLAPQNPYDLMQLDIFDSRLPPGSISTATGMTYLLGTDDQGRDILSGIIYGIRISLLVGFVTALLSFSIGTSAGLLAAYRVGRTESFIMRLVDLQLSFPAILVALVMLALFGKGVFNVILAITFVEWAQYARISRSSASVEKEREYVEAANNLCLSGRRIMFRHILPNCLPPLLVVLTMQIARAISLEATLSFLGLGVPITEPSLGLLISNGSKYMLSGEYWMCLFPGIALFIAILSINVIGEWMRVRLNPRGT